MVTRPLSSRVATVDHESTAIQDRGLARFPAIAFTWLAAIIVNEVLFAIGLAAGVDYALDEGKAWQMGIGVIVVSTALLVPGMALAALLSRRRATILRVAQVVGPALSLLTIGLTFSVDFDTASAVVLALMHVAAVPVMVVGLELIRRRDAWNAR